RADDSGALVLARRALAIDPENEAARRLVERMEEVMRTRGEALPAPEPAVQPAPDPAVHSGAPSDEPSQKPRKPSWRDRLLRR
ncbi:MAG TPA: hypothetical protein VD763_02325, partial [Candidatus Saccharimonadales bacterium]|nr:hypothetical protein [Candidatus Saccharimonadales bacterium]